MRTVLTWLLVGWLAFVPPSALAQLTMLGVGPGGAAGGGGGGIAQVQINHGSTINTTSIATSLGTATTPGNTIVIWAQGAGTITTPSGFTSRNPQVNQQGFYLFDKIGASGNSTDTPTLTMSGTFTATWMIAEYSGISAFDVGNGNNGTSTGNNVTPIATPSITPTAGARLLVAAVGGTRANPAAFDAGTPNTWTSSFVSQDLVQQASGSGTAQDALGHGWAALSTTANGSTAFSTSAILTDGVVSSYSPASIIAAYK